MHGEKERRRQLVYIVSLMHPETHRRGGLALLPGSCYPHLDTNLEEELVAPPVTFRMKMDIWLVAVAILCLAAALWAAGAAFSASPMIGIVGFFMIVGLVALVRLVSLPCSFEVGDEVLTLRAGISGRTIPYARIAEAYPSRTPLSTPYAWSLDRIRIEHLLEDGSPSMILLSVHDDQRFLETIASRSPSHTMDDARLVRIVEEKEEEPTAAPSDEPPSPPPAQEADATPSKRE
jgi:membrane protein YdbS with pleckstrin-like domain